MARITKAQAAAAAEPMKSAAVGDDFIPNFTPNDNGAAGAAVDRKIADCTRGFTPIPVPAISGNLVDEYMHILAAPEDRGLLNPVPPPPPTAAQRRPVGPESIGLGLAVGLFAVAAAVGDAVNMVGSLGRGGGTDAN